MAAAARERLVRDWLIVTVLGLGEALDALDDPLEHAAHAQACRAAGI